MATVTHRNTDSTTTAANTTFTSSSFTPAAGELIVFFAMGTGTTAVATASDSQGLSFQKVATVAWGGSAHRLYAWIAQILAANTAMTVTVDFVGDATTGVCLAAYGVSGMTRTGTAAVRQAASQANQTAGGTPQPTFSVSTLSTNPILGAIANSSNPSGITEPAGFTEQAGTPATGTGTNGDTGYNTPSAGLETIFVSSGQAITTLTWGSTSATVFCSLAIELDASNTTDYQMKSFERGQAMGMNRGMSCRPLISPSMALIRHLQSAGHRSQVNA